MSDDYITMKAAANMLDCSIHTVRQRIKAEGFDTCLINGRQMVARQDILDYAASHNASNEDKPKTNIRDALSRVVRGEMEGVVKALQKLRSFLLA